jgi:hypothetical protein
VAGHRGRQRPKVLKEAVGWAVASWLLAVGVMIWSGVDWLSLAFVSLGLLLVGLAPMVVLRLTGTRFRNLENLGAGGAERRLGAGGADHGMGAGSRGS